jgi:hypothetical protein
MARLGEADNDDFKRTPGRGKAVNSGLKEQWRTWQGHSEEESAG